ncbi:MAG: glycosyl hydrolase [Candidatus Bathyarchaeum sp.]|nr:MAG: glycosyl hydrolase [Candidatus Bathyarchaeum sp.]
MANYLIHEKDISETMAKDNKDREREDFFVSVIIPVFNEEVTIGDIVTRTKKTLEHMEVSYEVLVVDDGSEDKSAELAQQRKAVVLSAAHKGKGFALRSGFRRAKGKFVVTLDADGSHQPEEIPLVLRYLMENKADFVVGSRFVNSEANKTKIPKINRAGNRLFNSLTGYLTGVNISDSQSGFRAIRASLIKRMNLTSHGYEVESEMLVKALRMGARVAETSISFDQRTVGNSKLDPIRDGARIFYAIIASYLS